MRKNDEIWIRSAGVLKVVAVVLIILYIGFFTTGFFAGAMRGALTVIAGFSIWISLRWYYPEARRTKGRARSAISAVTEMLKMWAGFDKDSEVFRKVMKDENHPHKTD